MDALLEEKVVSSKEFNVALRVEVAVAAEMHKPLEVVAVLAGVVEAALKRAHHY